MSLTPSFYNENGLCIDPRRIEYASGGGIFDPNYNTAAPPASEDSPDLDERNDSVNNDTQSQPRPSARGQDGARVYSENHGSEELSPSPAHTTLNPKAAPFRPQTPRPSLTLDTSVRVRHQSRHARSVTPHILVSPAQDDRSDGGITPHKARHAGRTRSHSSPGRRPSFYGSHQQDLGSKNTLEPRAVSPMHLSPEMATATPAHWVMGSSYHVGDHLANSFSPPSTTTPTGQSTWSPASSDSTSTASAQSEGYRCDHEGCGEAEKIWTTKSDLRHHKRKHVPKSHWQCSCSVCGRQFQYPKDVRRHMNVHNRTHHTCPVCLKTYTREDNLTRHMVIMHNSFKDPTTPSQGTAGSPSASTPASFADSPYCNTVPTTPFTTSPVEARSTSSSSYRGTRSRKDNFHNDPFLVSKTKSGLSAPLMQRSQSDCT